ncbi:hypothetical protein [Bacilliculturomica massiliensis]|uniref:hypothetical protein n=1 Tax=Bacilliculturomica massiliensis TaxID=1917867 RepID=UPI001030D50D|nr:hypothetical protein [Bacilliculturomica massiliensis]
MDEKYEHLLLLEEEDYPILIEDECAELKPVIADFMHSWILHRDEPAELWLSEKLQEYLPEKERSEICDITEEIISALKRDEEYQTSLSAAVRDGRSKESWFASQVAQATSAMSVQESAKYLADLDATILNVNGTMYRTLTTQAGAVSQNPRLDGFIAEQYHAQTFNLNAEATGSPYRAKVLEPNGHGYKKNSVDIVIFDKANADKVVSRYQSKYCKDARATQKAFECGDYRGQQKLVPEGQQKFISKRATEVIVAPDGTKSKPLTKANAERMRDEAQSGKWNDLNWNEYKTKDLAAGIGRQVGYAALQGAAINIGFDVAAKIWNGEEIKGEEIVESALKGGADFGIKAAVAGALKVGVEKNILSVIPKGTPAGIIANIAFVAVEDAKVIGRMMSGDLSFKEGIEKLEQTTVATAGGLIAMGGGTAIGAAIGTFAGPVGVAVGGFVGGTVGYMAGSKICETITKGAQKLRNGVIETVKKVGTTVCETGKAVAEGVKDFCGGLVSGLAGFFFTF